MPNYERLSKVNFPPFFTKKIIKVDSCYIHEGKRLKYLLEK
jgi:hypothetical protein